MTPEKPQNYWQADEPDSPVAGGDPVQPVVEQPAVPVAQPELPMTAPDTLAEAEPTESVDLSSSQESMTEDTPDNPPITWSAEEYVHAEKGPVWFIIFIVVVLALVAVDVFFLRSWTFSALVVVMAVTLAIYIRRPARTLTYGLSPKQGLYVGEKLYSFEEFKAFGIIQDQGNFSIMLIPRKRFAPGVSVFFPEDVGERIVDILGQRLPMENLKLDLVDVIVRKLRL